MPGPPESSRAVDNRATSQRTTSSGGGPAGPATPSAANNATGPARSAKPKDQQSSRPPGPSGGGPQPTPGCIDFVTVNPEKSDAAKGTAVHRAVREQVAAVVQSQYGPRVSVRLSDASFAPYKDKTSLLIGGKRTGEGDVDLAFRSPFSKTLLLAEIKPANWSALIDGEQQLNNYINKANQSDQAKKAYGVTSFSPMLPDRFSLPPVVSQGRWFEIRWCLPGVIVYKEVRKKRDQDDETAQQSESQRARAQRGASAQDRSTSPAVSLPSWTPAQLRRDLTAGTLEDGLYRNRYQGAWPSGESTNVVVWVKTAATQRGVYRDVQFYQEFPSSPAFYERFARRRGLSDRQADLIRRTMIDYNRDLWSLIAPDPVTGRASGRSPEYARAELRTIYSEILKGVLDASARILGAGAAATSVTNAMARRGTPTAPAEPEPRSTPSREPPLPEWVSRAVQKGAELFRQVEEEMHALP